MLNNAEPCRRALCSCCVRRTMKDSPSDSWLHLAGSKTLSHSFCLSLLLPSLLCGPEWQGDSRLGISQSLPSSSVPSASQPGFWFQWEMRHNCEKEETPEETKQERLGEMRDEAEDRGWGWEWWVTSPFRWTAGNLNNFSQCHDTHHDSVISWNIQTACQSEYATAFQRTTVS